MSKVKGLNRSGSEGRRGVNEASLSMMSVAKRVPKKWKVRTLPISCRRCSYTCKMSAAAVARIFTHTQGNKQVSGWVCQECKKKDAIEINKAILAVYARKTKKRGD